MAAKTALTGPIRFGRRAGIGLAAGLALILAGLEPAAAGAFQPAALAGFDAGATNASIIKVAGGRKAAFAIIGGIAALGVGAAIASQNRRQDYGGGYDGGYGGSAYGGGYAPSYQPEPAYAPQPYDPPQQYYAPSAAYEPEEPYYAPEPPPVYYPDPGYGRHGYGRRGYGYGEDTVYRSPYSRHTTRLLREGN